jgi:hypothetical protein
MSQYGQAQPFSFFGYPQGYTGGFTPYQRIFNPNAAAEAAAAAQRAQVAMQDTTQRWNGEGDPPEGQGWQRTNLGQGQFEWTRTVSAPIPITGAGGSMGGATRETAESKYTPVSPLASPELGSPTFQALDAYGQTIVLPAALLAKSVSQNMLPGELAQAGENAAKAMEAAKEGYASGLLFGAPPSDVSTFAGGGYGVPGGLMTTPTGAGIPANPMSVDPAQAKAAIDDANARIAQQEAQAKLREQLEAPAPVPVVTAPPVEAPVPVVTAPPVEAPAITEGLLSTPQEVAADQAELQSLLSRYPAPVEAAPIAAPAPAAETAQQKLDRENYESAQAWQRERDAYLKTLAPTREEAEAIAKANAESAAAWQREQDRANYESAVAWQKAQTESDLETQNLLNRYPAPAGGGGSSSQRGGESVGGYSGVNTSRATSGQFGMDPSTRGQYAKGGYVSMQHLGGPDPDGPDDGYAALKDGEYVINDKAVKKYGIELMNAINSGKIKKGKLLGLLEM